nr:MAG TPA: hypothetical protein [Caudoviricetes sp.]DAS37870.1 MAG TPA: hypothetical protein [Caudoviricetes sp.]
MAIKGGGNIRRPCCAYAAHMALRCPTVYRYVHF